MTSTTDERPATIHAGCGRRHRPFTPCPKPTDDHDDQEVTDDRR